MNEDMYKFLINWLAAIFLVINMGCQKEYVAPISQGSATATADASKKPAETCPEYFYYYYNSKINLGEINTSQIIIGFQEGITLNQKEEFITKFTYLKSIKNEGTSGSADATVILLTEDLTCAEVEAALTEVAKEKEVLYATPFFSPSSDGHLVGITNQFIVNLKPGYTEKDLQKLTKRTQTQIIEQLGDITFILSASKNATGNALQMANEFAGFNPVDSAEPDFYYEF